MYGEQFAHGMSYIAGSISGSGLTQCNRYVRGLLGPAHLKIHSIYQEVSRHTGLASLFTLDSYRYRTKACMGAILTA